MLLYLKSYKRPDQWPFNAILSTVFASVFCPVTLK